MTGADPFTNRNAAVAPSRRCSCCSKLLSRHARADAKYCSTACRIRHWYRRRRTARALARKPKCAVCGQRLAITRRADAQCCSTRCRQAVYRARKAAAATAMPRKAHQRVIRERLAAADTAPPIPDISTAEVRPITVAEAKAIIEQYELMAAVCRFSFGIFFGDRCGGAVVYGDEYGENLGIWDRYGYRGSIIALLRGACVHWAHPHSASKLIRRSMDLLPPRYAVITATVDAKAGEVGTVYQAAGFDFVGTMQKGGRAVVRLNGKYVSERQAGRLAGTQGPRALARLGFDAISVPRRARYFAFRGDRHERERNRSAIAHLLQPYPKRAAAR
jgi:predicted nucleic acid-binding Zn ribbon protein